MDDFGLVRRGHWLVYGYRYGALRAAPGWLQSAIVTVWNWVACGRFGHEPIMVFEGKCCHCCREVGR